MQPMVWTSVSFTISLSASFTRCMLVACRYGPCKIADLQERMKRAVAGLLHSQCQLLLMYACGLQVWSL